MQETEAYITIEDHKEDFSNKISCPLINPTKSSIGKISKVIINQKMAENPITDPPPLQKKCFHGFYLY